MTPDLPPSQALVAQLLSLAQSGRASACVCFRSVSAHLLNAVCIEQGLIAFPLQGHKRAREGSSWIDVTPGQMLLVPNGRRVDVENIPDPRTGAYVALGIALCSPVVDAARQFAGPALEAERGSIASIPVDQHVDALLQWADAQRCGDAARSSYLLLGVVLDLVRAGHRGILLPRVAQLSERIRAMVAADPGRDWSSADVEHALAISGATLRRHLASEATNLRSVLIEARLSAALHLLLSTRLPVKTVAQRVGYDSPSAFVKRFTERYGVEPSRVGTP